MFRFVNTCFKPLSTILVLTIVGGPACAQQPGVRRSAPGRVHLIYGGDAEFDAAAEKFFPDIVRTSEYAAIKSTSMILANDAAVPIRVAAIKWIIETGAESKTQFVLIGSTFDDVTNLVPGSASLVSPLSHTESNSEKGLKQDAEFIRAYAHSARVDRLITSKKITGSLDAVLFSNDIFLGPDTYGLANLYTCERRATIAEAKQVEALFPDHAAIQRLLAADSTASGHEKKDACSEADRIEALRLESLERTEGQPALDKAIEADASSSVPAVRRLPYFRRDVRTSPSNGGLDSPSDRLRPDRHGLILAEVSDPDVAQALDSGYPGLRTDSHLDPFRPLMVYLRNESTQNILAYTVVFHVVPLHGQPEAIHVTIEHRADLPGRIGDLFPVLEPRESRVIGPWFNWGTLKWVDHHETDKFAGLANVRFVSSLSAAKSVDVSLDAVVFEDNSIVGPDVYDLRSRFESLRNGQRAEGVAVAQMFAENQALSSISGRLQADISLGRDALGKSDRESLEVVARAARASEFAHILQKRGPEALRVAACRLASYSVTTLQVEPEYQYDPKVNTK